MLYWIDSTCAPNGAITFSLWDFIARIVPHEMSIPSVVALITILDVESLHIWLPKSGLRLNHQMFARLNHYPGTVLNINSPFVLDQSQCLMLKSLLDPFGWFKAPCQTSI